MAKDIKISKEKLKKIRFAVSVAAVIVFALLMVIISAQKLGNITLTTISSEVKSYFMSFGSGDGYPYAISSDSVSAIDEHNSNLVMLTDKRTIILNSTAKEISPQEHTYSNPIMKMNGSKILVYDLDSAKYRIQSGSDIIAEFQSDGKIMSGAIGRKGNYAIATRSDTAESVLEVYGKNKKIKLKQEFTNQRVFDIALSDNGKYVAVAVVSVKDGSMNSQLLIYGINSSKLVSKFDYPSTTLVRIDYVKGDSLAVIGTDIRSYIKGNKQRIDNEDFDSDIIHNYSVADNGSSALIVSKYGSTSLSSLSFYSKSNDKKYTVDFDKEAIWVDTDGKYTAVLFEGEIKTYNKSGKQVGSISFDGEPVRIIVDGRQTYVLTSSGIRCYKTRGTTEERQGG